MTAERGLSVAESESLVQDGYLVVPALLDADTTRQLRADLAVAVATEIAAGHERYDNPVTVEPGVIRQRLDLADPAYRRLREPKLLADAATAVLGNPWHMSGLSLRAPLPGCGHQGLHPDFGNRRPAGPWQALSALWCISPFTPDNGPLRVIPGSHRTNLDPDRCARSRLRDGTASS